MLGSLTSEQSPRVKAGVAIEAAPPPSAARRATLKTTLGREVAEARQSSGRVRDRRVPRAGRSTPAQS